MATFYFTTFLRHLFDVSCSGDFHFAHCIFYSPANLCLRSFGFIEKRTSLDWTNCESTYSPPFAENAESYFTLFHSPQNVIAMKALIVVLILICFNQRVNSQVLVVEFDAHLRYNTGQVHEYEKVIDEKYHLETFSRFGILNKYVFDIDHMVLYYYANNDLFSTLKINEAHLENNIWFVELDDFCLETKEKVM